MRILIAALVLSAPASAQNAESADEHAQSKHRAQLSLTWSAVALGPAATSNPFAATPEKQLTVPTARGGFGTFVLGLHSKVGSRFWLGGCIYWGQFSVGDSFFSITGERISSRYTNVGIAGEGRYDYLQHDRWSLYGTVGLAVVYRREVSVATGPYSVATSSVSSLGLQGQLTALGFSYGRRFLAVAEAGVGYRGIISLGAAYQF